MQLDVSKNFKPGSLKKEAQVSAQSASVLGQYLNHSLSRSQTWLALIKSKLDQPLELTAPDLLLAFDSFNKAPRLASDLAAETEISVILGKHLINPEINQTLSASINMPEDGDRKVNHIEIYKKRLLKFFERVEAIEDFKNLDCSLVINSRLIYASILSEREGCLDAAVENLTLVQKMLEKTCPGNYQDAISTNNLFSQVGKKVLYAAARSVGRVALENDLDHESWTALEQISSLHDKLRFIENADPEFLETAAILKDSVFVLKLYFAFSSNNYQDISSVPMDSLERLNGFQNRGLGILLKTAVELMDTTSKNESIYTFSEKLQGLVPNLERASPANLFLSANVLAKIGMGYLLFADKNYENTDNLAQQQKKARTLLSVAKHCFNLSSRNGLEPKLWAGPLAQTLFSLAGLDYKFGNFSECYKNLTYFSIICPDTDPIRARGEYAIAFIKHSTYAIHEYRRNEGYQARNFMLESAVQSALATNPILSQRLASIMSPANQLFNEALAHLRRAKVLATNPVIKQQAIKAIAVIKNNGVLPDSSPF